MAKKNKNEMSFLDHLEDLRWLLVRSSAVIVLMAIVTYAFSDFIFDDIIFGPTHTDFITYRFFCDLAQSLGVTGDICVNELPFTIQNTSMEGQINVFIWTCITAGFILAFPYILYELWKFISPALYEKEKKGAIGFIVISSVLFFLGVLFGYFVIVPLSINFVATFSVSDVVKNEFNLDSYIGMIKTSVIAAGLFFELPIIIYFLTKLGLVTPNFLRKYRKYAIVILLIVAAIVTPPDVVSQITVAIPMLIIYELSIFLSVFVEKQKLKNG
ncbi:MAG: twin-arginine translocase subunit TatC [Flavobacterium sp.]|jgi:sec-independent protein translocase protein TatC|uniref:Sec-independent protein translocase protein TatC n=1 Tax=Flavobacterium macrobrachii TaxID=591204 RepID=A0ABS2CWH0_9FLAO|nr:MULTISPECIES: twin-arginine translocase subunit TatC [Flavobacterium]MBM6499239.1 twin-arginine translocase subunit TatC [Flavobacterium macrobrachii]MCZ8091081.1 twin-arginine translocase subunit TatC [Flavobacterium sp.]MCZ8330750.1 twin-arginine translocase subunit TatC [Flavobacterium sp.]PZO28617.1 MAG: twin-arginine translocase subunit TatC [Flavobacteriaceae bacterium]